MIKLNEKLNTLSTFSDALRLKKDQATEGYADLVCLLARSQGFEVEGKLYRDLHLYTWLFLDHRIDFQEYREAMTSVLMPDTREEWVNELE